MHCGLCLLRARSRSCLDPGSFLTSADSTTAEKCLRDEAAAEEDEDMAAPAAAATDDANEIECVGNVGAEDVLSSILLFFSSLQ